MGRAAAASSGESPRQPPTRASAIMKSWLQVVSAWLRLWYEILESTVASRLRLPRPHGFADSISFFSGIHPHLPQRRGDAYPLPSPVATGADGCTVSVTRSASALGAAHTRLSARPHPPRYSTQPMREVRSMPTGNGPIGYGYIVTHGAVGYGVTFRGIRNTMGGRLSSRPS